MPGCRFPLRKHSIFFAEKNIFKLEACNFCEHPWRKRTSHETPYKKSKPSPKPGFYQALKPNEGKITMKVLEKGVLRQSTSWFKAGIGLGVMLFMAFTLLSVLDRGADGDQSVVKPVYVSRPVAVVRKAPDDYRMIREQNRFVTDLVDELSRIVSRLAH